MIFHEGRITELVQALLRHENTRVAASSSSMSPPQAWARVLGPAIKSRTLTRATLPIVTRRLCRHEGSLAGWLTALRLLQHPLLRKPPAGKSSTRDSSGSSTPGQPNNGDAHQIERSSAAYGFGARAVANELCDDATLWCVLEAEAPSKEAQHAIAQVMRVLVRQR